MEEKKLGWKNSEDRNKCLARPTVEVTAEMDSRGVEVSRTSLNDSVYVTYYDSVSEVYWMDKI